MLIARAPEVPSIATHDLLRRKIHAAIHRFENVRGDLRKIGSGFSSRFRFVGWLVFFATGKCQGQAGANADSGPGETEKIAFSLEERLHRAIIDISPANREARTILENEGQRSGWQPAAFQSARLAARRLTSRRQNYSTNSTSIGAWV
jgi:hypothetical protein